MTTAIRKALIPSHGDASHIEIIDATIEAPAAHEVQVKVIYAGMGGADFLMREGTYPQQKRAPLTPGYNLVGRVHVNGPGSHKFQVGDMVACLTKYDADAELCNCAEEYLVPVPKGVDLKQAVSLVLDWVTAYGMVYRTAQVTKGQKVFIHGLSGSVGYALLTLCKLEGAEIYGTASPSKHDHLRKDGVTPFSYRDKNWIEAMKDVGGAEAVFDPLGYESWDESWQIINPKGGRLVGYGGNQDVLNGESETRSQIPSIAKLLARGMVPFCPKATSFFYIDKDQKTYKPELQALFDMLVAGKIQVPIKKVWTLEQIPEAHQNRNQPGIGSIVVKINDDPEA
ncbi:GroES-like protein [Bimuria novae-zelandiae CBS 107.79]|uniref:GroES-like protein n=1 Tax=Bimuria novae-zelandiae CBS 107.79 TaxID=1447943 RepID=A0A6A5UJG2_9PLEO|nr:GroES-like protein [Bimuria novae-zelandiae CBS 107.79]